MPRSLYTEKYPPEMAAILQTAAATQGGMRLTLASPEAATALRHKLYGFIRAAENELARSEQKGVVTNALSLGLTRKVVMGIMILVEGNTVWLVDRNESPEALMMRKALEAYGWKGAQAPPAPDAEEFMRRLDGDRYGER
jgi:hypothetical protein